MANPSAQPLQADLESIIASMGGKHAGPQAWKPLKNSRIFITGGTGFFGTWLLEALSYANRKLDLQSQILVLARTPAIFKDKNPHLFSAGSNITFHLGDVRDFAFPEGRFTHLIHAATTASAKLNNENPNEMIDTIIEGTRRTLDFAKHSGIKRYLLTSSGAVYGTFPDHITHVPEDYIPALPAESAYAEGKRKAENLCADYSRRYQFDTLIARCFAFVGPHLPLESHFAIGNFIGDALAARPIRVAGDGTALRSYLYAADLVDWLLTVLLYGQSCRPYNIGSADAISVGELARLVSQTVAREFPDLNSDVLIAKTSALGVAPSRYVPEVDRIQNELGVRLRTPLSEAIIKTVRWHRGIATS